MTVQELQDFVQWNRQDNTLPEPRFKSLQVFSSFISSPDNQLPPNAQPLTPYVRGGIDLNALDNVGITLSGHQGTGTFSSSLSSSVPPPLSSPAPPAPTSHSVPPPPME